MLLSDLLQVVATGENVEVFVFDTDDMYQPFNELMPKDWDEYQVKYFYSVLNENKKDTKTHIEVTEMEV